MVDLGVLRIVMIVRGSIPVIAVPTICPLLYRVSSFFLILLLFIGLRGRCGGTIIRGCRYGVKKRDSGKRDFSCFSLKLMTGDCIPLFRCCGLVREVAHGRLSVQLASRS